MPDGLNAGLSPLLNTWLDDHPTSLSSMSASLRRRTRLMVRCQVDATFRELEREACRRDVVLWISHWGWTYAPGMAALGLPAWIPLDLYPKQIELLRFIEEHVKSRKDGLIEKSRDIGFTWIAGGFALHKWLFVKGFKTTFGSRKEEYVDRLGDPDSIFEKIRMLMRGLPRWMWPPGFDVNKHDNHMRLLNPVNGNVIRGEAGDEMGRGGRSTLYVLDEAAFLEKADRVDAATVANSMTRIWASTVNGPGNLFCTKRFSEAMVGHVFTYHYRDDPRKDAAWEADTRAKMDEAKFASEYGIDYTASVEGICIPGRWIEAATRIDGLSPSRRGVGGLDVGGGGKGKSVFIARFGSVVTMPVSWGDPDTTETAERGLELADTTKPDNESGEPCDVRLLNYDSVGIGAGVQSTLRRHKKTGIITAGVNVGVAPSERVWKDGETSKEKFANLKAELWFLARERFKCTYETVCALEDEAAGRKSKFHVHEVEDLISIPPEARNLITQLSTPKWFRTEKGKIIMESKAQLATRGVSSPDEAEALVLTFAQSGALEVWSRLGGGG